MDKKRKAKVLRWCKDNKHTLDDIYNEFSDEIEDFTTQELIREYIIYGINKEFYVAHVLQAIEDNSASDYFIFDSASNFSPEPIFDTSELADHIKNNY